MLFNFSANSSLLPPITLSWSAPTTISTSTAGKFLFMSPEQCKGTSSSVSPCIKWILTPLFTRVSRCSSANLEPPQMTLCILCHAEWCVCLVMSFIFQGISLTKIKSVDSLNQNKVTKTVEMFFFTFYQCIAWWPTPMSCDACRLWNKRIYRHVHTTTWPQYQTLVAAKAAYQRFESRLILQVTKENKAELFTETLAHELYWNIKIRQTKLIWNLSPVRR